MSRLEDCRDEIDVLDQVLLATLARRLRFCATIAKYKRDHGMPMLQPARAAVVLLRVRRLASEYGVRPEFAEALFTHIMEEACRLGDEIIAGNCPTEAEID